MCYHVSVTIKGLGLAKRFKARFPEAKVFKPVYHASAFSFPFLPVITNRDAQKIQLFRWGLVPHWVKDEKSAETMRIYTLNAKAETVFEKPSFRSSIKAKRCLVLVDGFYEWQHVGKKAYPYYVALKKHAPFALGGIWDEWVHPKTGELFSTFSIVTTRANSLMEKIHNTKKRMPLVLEKADETQWLRNDLDEEQVKSMLVPFDPGKLAAHTISKLITDRTRSSNVPAVTENYTYPELAKKAERE